MKALITETGQYGPFTSINQTADRWVCDGAEFQFSVIGDATIGEWVAPPPALPTVDEYTNALTSMLDKEAQSHMYDDRISCALRAGYPGPFHAEGVAFAMWMDGCNAQAYTLMAQVQASTAPQPTMEQFMAIFPKMVWP
jgi:hypothetical protein